MRSSRAAYERYLHSPAWKAKRFQALEAADFRCAGCSSSDALQVHHLTYERLGFERITDLMVLCEQCHALEHGKAMRAGMPIAGLSLHEMTHEARQRDRVRRLAAEEGRDIRSARWNAEKKAARQRSQDAGGQMNQQSQTSTLSVATMPAPNDPEPACEGTYVCACPTCEADRANAISRGHRPRRPLPLKRAA